MTPTDEYAAYVTALQAVIELPKAYAAQVDSIERRAGEEIGALDQRRNERAQRWTQHRDTSSRLARRANDLAGKVGAGPPSLSAPEPILAQAIPEALESLRADLDRAEQSWQWLVRHRERQVAASARAPQPSLVAPVPPPVPVQVPSPPAPPAKSGVSPTVLIGVGAAVIVILVVVIIVMAI